MKNGFATLADKVFIGENVPESAITIPVLKASTGNWTRALFPYDSKGKPLSESVVFANPAVKSYFLANKELLLKGKPEFDGWYLYGRTQAIADVHKPKLSINALVRHENDFKLVEMPSGTGVYSGLYAIANEDVSFGILKEIIQSRDFVSYVKLLKKYKSGGYYTFNSKDIENYLNYSLTLMNK